MKKFYTLCILATALTLSSKAQNVLLFENFEDTTTYGNIHIADPTGNDTSWIDYDYDLLPDGSGSTTPRANEWFLSRGFADVDSTNTVMASNSWTNDQTPVANYLILPPIHLTDNSGMLSWKIAARQAPRYVDGMQILVSTTQNLAVNYSDTLKQYGEYVSGSAAPNDSSFFGGTYVFSNVGFILGSDYQYVEYHNDSARFIGVLRPDSVSLSAYAGQTIYIAFCSGTTDDNLLSIDDIKVTGQGIVNANSPSSKNQELTIYPNPTSNKFTVQYTLPLTQHVNLSVFDVTGRNVKTIFNNMCVKGNYNFDVSINDLPAGNYTVVLKTSKGESVSKITKM
ncbi:MAG: choice-of-anchor J domain-containing protein [Bacteroidota bacterium]